MSASAQNVNTGSVSIDLSGLLHRVSVLEQEVAELKNSGVDLSDWIERIDGTFKDDPGFDEIIELGRQIRKSDFT